MNPFCSNCKKLLELKLVTWTDKATGVLTRYYAAKFYVCPKCKRKYKAGYEVIQ